MGTSGNGVVCVFIETGFVACFHRQLLSRPVLTLLAATAASVMWTLGIACKLDSATTKTRCPSSKANWGSRTPLRETAGIAHGCPARRFHRCGDVGRCSSAGAPVGAGTNASSAAPQCAARSTDATAAPPPNGLPRRRPRSTDRPRLLESKAAPHASGKWLGQRLREVWEKVGFRRVQVLRAFTGYGRGALFIISSVDGRRVAALCSNNAAAVAL